MLFSATRSEPNIQEKHNSTSTQRATAPTSASGIGQPPETHVEVLAVLLRSSDFTGDVLRVLVHRVRHPAKPYTSKELEVLLTLTLALERAGMWR